MRKTPFVSFLVGALLISTFAFSTSFESNQVNGSILSYSDLIKSKPGTINDSYAYESVMEYHFNEGDITYFDMSDSTTNSITYEYGYEDKGIGSALYLDTPGGNFNTLMRCRTNSNIDISSASGVMFYVDFSGVLAQEGHYIGVGLGLMLMDSSIEPPNGGNMWSESHRNGHFSHYYPLEGKSAFYYDLNEGKFVATTIINRCTVIKEQYQGWLYIPFSSYSWNAQPDNKYIMNADAFDNGYNWLNYSHFLTQNIKNDDTQSRIYFDELNFVKKTNQVDLDYQYQYTLSPTCFDIGGDLYYDFSSNNYKLINTVSRLEHDYTYYKFKNGAIGICSQCNDLVFTEEQGLVNGSLSKDTSSYVDIHFHYGDDLQKEKIVIVEKGHSIARDKEPKVERITKSDNWEYDFSAWSIDELSYKPHDPKANFHYGETHYYANYLISSYDRTKYSHVTNLLAMHGGRYGSAKGQIVMNGNSNFALAYNTTRDFAARGLPLINNAVAGGSSYNYYYYSDQLVLGFAPKILVFNLTTNDQAYWSMSEKDILSITKQYIEKVHNALPNCAIAVVNASPLPGRSEMFATIERVNNMVKLYTESEDYLYYIDTYDFVYERMMEYPEGWEFWTHMETDTLSTWMDMIADGLIQIVDERGIVF